MNGAMEPTKSNDLCGDIVRNYRSIELQYRTHMFRDSGLAWDDVDSI
jgi:hypothetical protein